MRTSTIIGSHCFTGFALCLNWRNWRFRIISAAINNVTVEILWEQIAERNITLVFCLQSNLGYSMLLRETLTRRHFVAETLQPALKRNATDNCWMMLLVVLFFICMFQMWIWQKVDVEKVSRFIGTSAWWGIAMRPSLLLSSKWKCPQISVIVLIHTLWSKVLQFT